MTSNHLIHIVDDSTAVRISLERLLASVGFRTKSFPSAIEYLEELDVIPSCLVLDQSMPNMTGRQLQQKLLEIHPEISILFLTGLDNIPVKVKAMRDGAVDFIQKPVDEHHLLEAVHRGVALYEQKNRG